MDSPERKRRNINCSYATNVLVAKGMHNTSLVQLMLHSSFWLTCQSSANTSHLMNAARVHVRSLLPHKSYIPTQTSWFIHRQIEWDPCHQIPVLAWDRTCLPCSMTTESACTLCLANCQISSTIFSDALNAKMVSTFLIQRLMDTNYRSVNKGNLYNVPPEQIEQLSLLPDIRDICKLFRFLPNANTYFLPFSFSVNLHLFYNKHLSCACVFSRSW